MADARLIGCRKPDENWTALASPPPAAALTSPLSGNAI
jgi:hypothetical protein